MISETGKRRFWHSHAHGRLSSNRTTNWYLYRLFWNPFIRVHAATIITDPYLRCKIFIKIDSICRVKGLVSKEKLWCCVGWGVKLKAGRLATVVNQPSIRIWRSKERKGETAKVPCPPLSSSLIANDSLILSWLSVDKTKFLSPRRLPLKEKLMNLLPFAHLPLYTLLAPKRLHNHWVLRVLQSAISVTFTFFTPKHPATCEKKPLVPRVSDG